MATRLFDAGAQDVLYLIDLSGYVFRAYHAIAPLNSPSGEPTHAVLGTVNMLERLVRQCRPAMLAVAMDSRKKTFRKELYPEYKANRPPPPEDLKQQMKRTGEVIAAFPIECFQADGFEADDLIATVVERCRKAKIRVVIVSADKDLMQLVGDDVILWDTMRDRVFGIPEVEERFGVKVSQVGDVLALMGDSSDNVPGVPSVGPKTARDLLNQFGSLEKVFAGVEEIKRKKLKETLKENEAQAKLSRKLVTLKADVDIDFDAGKLKYGGRNLNALRELYTELGFQRHLTNLDKELGAPGDASSEAQKRANPPKAMGPIKTELVTSEAQLKALSKALDKAERLTLYTCTQGRSAMDSALVGLALCCEQGIAYYIPLEHRYVGAPKQLPAQEVLDVVQKAFKRSKLQIGAYDLKRVQVVLEQLGIQRGRADFDPLLASYLIDAEAGHQLERIVQAELGLTLSTEDDLVKIKGKRTKLQLDEVPVEQVCEFAATRAACVFSLWQPILTRIDEEVLTGLWAEIELPLLPVLAQLEQTGILLDSNLLKTLGTKLGKQLKALEKQAHDVVGKPFNVNSPKQLEKILFDDMGLKPLKRTKTSRSTDAATLEALSDEHELPKIVLEIRQLSKLKGTYIDALPELVNPKTGRLHTVWHQEGAATGRLSSSDPNLQNIPIRTELGKQIREAFIARDGYQLVSADYSQIELRVLAHLSQDPVLLDAFKTGQDIHLRTAMEIFEVDEEDVDAELRRRAKAVNFGVIYGQGDSALGKSLGISRMEAGQFIAAYFRRYAGVREFMDNTLQTARASGSVRTLFGRRRPLKDIHSANRARRLAAERVAMNTPIQGTAADLIKLAMLKLKDPVAENAKMLLTVHDELVFEVPNEHVEKAKQKIVDAMENVHPLDVPLIVEAGHGPNWRAAH